MKLVFDINFPIIILSGLCGVGCNTQQVMQILKRIPAETRKKLSGKGYFPQDGYILQQLPVPPNCLSVPVVSDGITVMSSVSYLHTKLGSLPCCYVCFRH